MVTTIKFKQALILFGVLAMTLFMADGLLAAEERTSKSDVGKTLTTPRVNEILGLNVKTHDGQELGEVKDLIINPDGSVSHLVLSQGGVLGAGSEMRAVPWRNPSIHENALIINLSKEKVQNAPSFSSWENFDEQKVRAYFGEESKSGTSGKKSDY